MSADTFRHSAVRRHSARPVPDRLRRCPAVQLAAVTVSRAAICLAGTGGQLCAHRTGEPARRISACRRECAARAVQSSATSPLDGGMALRHLADGRFTRLLNGIAGVSVLVLLAGGVLLWKSGIWRMAVSRWIDGHRFLWTRVTVGANIVRPQTVRFHAVREHTVLPCGITVADEAAPEYPALR